MDNHLNSHNILREKASKQTETNEIEISNTKNKFYKY